MSMITGRETAKIYQFPRRTRTFGDGRRDVVRAVPDLDVRADVADCDSWYHQAAVSSERTRKP